MMSKRNKSQEQAPYVVLQCSFAIRPISRGPDLPVPESDGKMEHSSDCCT